MRRIRGTEVRTSVYLRAPRSCLPTSAKWNCSLHSVGTLYLQRLKSWLRPAAEIPAPHLYERNRKDRVPSLA